MRREARGGLDRSHVDLSYHKDLANPGRARFKPLRITAPRYCNAHILYARPGLRGRNAKPAPSLLLTGRYRLEGETAWRPFRIETRAAYGRFFRLPARRGEAPGRSIVGGLRVTVSRPLDTLFSGIDMARASEPGVGCRILQKLARETFVRVR